MTSEPPTGTSSLCYLFLVVTNRQNHIFKGSNATDLKIRISTRHPEKVSCLDVLDVVAAGQPDPLCQVVEPFGQAALPDQPVLHRHLEQRVVRAHLHRSDVMFYLPGLGVQSPSSRPAF